MTCGLVEEVVYGVAEVACGAKHGVKKLFHAMHIRNAKDACEEYIEKYTKPKRNQYSDYYKDSTYKTNISEFYDSCSPKDKESILKSLQIKIEKSDKKIKELNEGKETLKYCIFLPKPSKAVIIKEEKYKRDRCDELLQMLSKKPALRPN